MPWAAKEFTFTEGAYWSSLAFASDGTPHITYSETAVEGEGIWHAWQPGGVGAWAHENISSSRVRGPHDIAVDGDGYCHVLYCVQILSGATRYVGFHYATNATGSWADSIIHEYTSPDDPPYAYRYNPWNGGCTITVDATGNPYGAFGYYGTPASYTSTTPPKTWAYFYFWDGSTATQVAYDEYSNGTNDCFCLNQTNPHCIAIDGDGDPHVLHKLQIYSGATLVKADVLYWDGSTDAIIESTGSSCGAGGLVLDDDEAVHIALWHYTGWPAAYPASLEYATNATGSWVVEEVASKNARGGNLTIIGTNTIGIISGTTGLIFEGTGAPDYASKTSGGSWETENAGNSINAPVIDHCSSTLGFSFNYNSGDPDYTDHVYFAYWHIGNPLTYVTVF